jgi:7,8-dihydroneopterin aldolase/epimerase/oxygenase
MALLYNKNHRTKKPPRAPLRVQSSTQVTIFDMNQIFIHEFRVDAWVGIYEWEMLRPQTLELNIDIGLAGETAGKSDNIKDTIHYGTVVERIQKDLAAKRFNLLEALAEHLAHIIVDELGAAWTRISVAKLGHIRGVKRVGVLITRGKIGA